MPQVGRASLEAAGEIAISEALQSPAVLGGDGVPGLGGSEVEQVDAAQGHNITHRTVCTTYLHYLGNILQ